MKSKSTTTKLAGVLGNPISHSLSPKLHGYLAEKTGADLSYLAFCPVKEDLKKVLHGGRALGVLGFNITSPYKIPMYHLVDRLDPEAEKMGNVNTLVNEQGVWVGYNTDGEGFLRALSRRGYTAQDKHILLMGTGGTARTLSYKLAQEKASSITIVSRKENPEEELISLLSEFPETTVYGKYNREMRYDIAVNCTPLGMAPYTDRNPAPEGFVYHPELLCCDLIYNPEKTLFLQEAERHGAQILNGMDMFLYQGLLAFEKFTGITVSDALYDGLFDHFKGEKTE